MKTNENKIIFMNPQNKIEHTIDISKKNTYIYGGNGVGKTTFSREAEIKVNESKVFNVDFINKNLFIVDKDGIKDDSNTKDSLTKLLIDEHEIKIKKQLIKLEEKFKKNKERINQINSSLNKIFQKNKYYQNVEILYSDIENNYSFSYDFDKTDEENFNSIKIEAFLKTKIETDEELEIIIRSINEQANIQIALKFIKDNKILNKIINEDIDLLNNEIKNKNSSYLENLNKMKEAENCFFRTNDKEKYKNWIRDGLLLHESVNNCLFCENKNIDNQKENWKNKLEMQILQNKSDLLEVTNEIINGCNEFLKTDIYTQYFPLITESLKKIKDDIDIFKNKITENEEIIYQDIKIKRDILLDFIEDKLIEVRNYILNKNLNEYYSPTIIENEMNLLKTKWEFQLEQEYDIYKKNLQEKLNFLLKSFGCDREMKIVIDKKSSQRKISLKMLDESKLNTLSEGQKHKLALAIFFVKITEFYSTENKLKYIILDDPVSTLDVNTQHAIRDYLFNVLGSYYENIIILTHNFNYLMLMLSNLHENDEEKNNTKLLYLGSSKCLDININDISNDDISLFVKSFQEITDLNDISIWRWIIFKIYRTILNIKMSLMALNSFKDPIEDIKVIFSNNEINKNKAIEINKMISENFYKSKIKVEKIREMLNNLMLFSELLGLPINLDDQKIEGVFLNLNIEDWNNWFW
ncbi:AAA family ATPase [Spiroplasma endosymbiont of Cantharis lateralis]|uniref:AAA family ATPase n=1 Tax=Spiroplasma endosymbiont of Cantharis lateralis TaxID=3066277 RepID=UPI00313C4B8D